jgi:hypothetical protein
MKDAELAVASLLPCVCNSSAVVFAGKRNMCGVQ